PVPESKLRVIPLGGLGEVGKNMLVFETREDIVVIDAGVLFPEEVDMPGVEIVIPNIEYLVERADRVRAVLVTHGHEDHIGALPYVLRDLKAPVFAPRFAMELIRKRLREHGLLEKADLTVVGENDLVRLGAFEVQWFETCHSIPDSHGLAIRTPAGTVIHSGDFKIDQDPVIGYPSEFGRLSALAADGVILLLSDSTYAEDEGYSGSDRQVAESLHRLIGDAPGRVFVASFASQIARVQMVADAAAAHGRKLALVGKSMVENSRIARELGFLDVPNDTLVTVAEAASLPESRVAFMVTGSQGEANSVLARMARGENREISVHPGDTVIISAAAIPGNETAVYGTVDDLVRLGARVLYSRNTYSETVHVHGHARREELRMMLNHVRPRFFVPVHGEYRMLVAHADVAVEQGLAGENVFVLTDGDVLELGPDGAEVIGRVPAGHVFVHGLGIWDESGNVLVERRSLAHDGIVMVAVAREAASGRVLGQPKIMSAGFVHTLQAPGLFQDALEDMGDVLDRAGTEALDWTELERQIRATLGRFLARRTKRRPLIIPVSLDL
ncbi:MAG: ribonuclease J, partial [Gemmatimonadetes bacterium]|nr:ribonuclease J [Gemmatimonadota bacterium]